MAQIKAELGSDAIILSNQRSGRDRPFTKLWPLEAPGMPKIRPNVPPVDDTDLREEWARLRRQLGTGIKPQMDMGLLTPDSSWFVNIWSAKACALVLLVVENSGARRALCFRF